MGVCKPFSLGIPLIFVPRVLFAGGRLSNGDFLNFWELAIVDLAPYCRYAIAERGYVLKIKGKFSHAVTQEVVVLLNSNRNKVRPSVGKSWQPDVAQFLLDMFPDALDYGLQLSDIAELVSEEELDFDMEGLEFLDFDDDDDDTYDEDDDI